MIFNRAERGNKNRRKSKEEQWGWWEDPYKATSSEGWYQEVLGNHGGQIPAPSPKFGTMPPVHTGTHGYA